MSGEFILLKETLSLSGEGGRLGVKGATLAQYVAQSLVKRKPDKYENDPRAAILRHAKEAAENPFWIDPAYKKSAPYSYLILCICYCLG